MVEKGPPAPTPKPVRAKIPAQTKVKATPKPSTSKTNIPLEPKVVIWPVDQQEDHDTHYPPNQLNQLTYIPAAQQEQAPNPPNPPKTTKLTKSATTTWHNARAKSSPTTSIKLVLF